MRPFYFGIVSLLAAACSGGANNFECSGNAGCDLSGGGMCIAAPSGRNWCAYPDPACPGGYRYSDQNVGDGLAGQCVAPGDGGIIDGTPANSIVENFQNADLVIGQSDFQSASPNAGAGPASCTAKTLYQPFGLCSDGASLYVTDDGNVRVLAWSPAPLSTFTDANRVVGKSSFSDSSAPSNLNAANMAGSLRCDASGGALAVSDEVFGRVLLWNPAPSVNGPSAQIALGAPNFTSLGGGTSATLLKQPKDVWTNATRVIVADSGNNRVMVWNAFPAASGQAADLVLGQTNFTTGTSLSPATATSLNGPEGVLFDGTRLYVADTKNNRVLIWNSMPTSNGQAADVVVGQPDFAGNSAGHTATTMSRPHDVLVVGDTLFVADTSNDRVLVFKPIPTTNGAAARFVLGQFDLTTGGNNPAATQKTFDEPWSLARVGDKLFVSDNIHHRVLRFTLNLNAN